MSSSGTTHGRALEVRGLLQMRVHCFFARAHGVDCEFRFLPRATAFREVFKIFPAINKKSWAAGGFSAGRTGHHPSGRAHWPGTMAGPRTSAGSRFFPRKKALSNEPNSAYWFPNCCIAVAAVEGSSYGTRGRRRADAEEWGLKIMKNVFLFQFHSTGNAANRSITKKTHFGGRLFIGLI